MSDVIRRAEDVERAVREDMEYTCPSCWIRREWRRKWAEEMLRRLDYEELTEEERVANLDAILEGLQT